MKSTVTSSLLSGSVGPGLNKLSVDFDDLSANFFLSSINEDSGAYPSWEPYNLPSIISNVFPSEPPRLAKNT